MDQKVYVHFLCLFVKELGVSRQTLMGHARKISPEVYTMPSHCILKLQPERPQDLKSQPLHHQDVVITSLM
jgi:hypothetical protein